MSIDWTAVSAIATGIAALATSIAAGVTAWMVLQMKKHHQDGFRPICILENHYGPNDPYRRNKYLTVETCDWQNDDLLISAQLKLKNIGSGPALRVRMVLLFPDNNLESGYVVELIPLPAKGEYCNENNYISESRGEGPADSGFGKEKTPIQFRLSKQDYTERKFGFRLPESEAEVRPIDVPWEIVLEYEDVFGKKFHTVHTKDALHPWTKVGIGPINLPVSIRKEIERQDQLDHLPRMSPEFRRQCWEIASKGTLSHD